MNDVRTFRATTKYVITGGGTEILGYASELHVAEDMASQHIARQIWRRQDNGTYKLISKPRYMQ